MLDRPVQTRVSLFKGSSILYGSVVSPYYPYRGGTNKTTMNLKAFVTSYTTNSSNIELDVYFKSDDSTVNAGTTLAVPFSYSDTAGTIQATANGLINTFCSNASLPVPTIDWLSTTPTDLAAAIAAATPVAPSSYQTIVTQTGTAAPAVSGSLAPANTYAGAPTFTWARSSAGVYTLTASAAVFNTSGKTGVFVAPLQNLNASVRGIVTSSTVITVTTAVQSVAVLGLLGLTTTPTDALLAQTMIYVQTYA